MEELREKVRLIEEISDLWEALDAAYDRLNDMVEISEGAERTKWEARRDAVAKGMHILADWNRRA